MELLSMVIRIQIPLSILVLLFSLMIGCSQPIPPDMVSGKVTLDGKPVIGEIIFIGADGKQVTSSVGPTGGAYSIGNPPQGEVTIVIRSLAGMTMPAGAGPPPNAGEASKTMASTGGITSVPAPAKYADPQTSDLRYTVKPGKQEHDIQLTP